jgi:hypothetical protein
VRPALNYLLNYLTEPYPIILPYAHAHSSLSSQTVTNKPSLLRAILGSKIAIAITTLLSADLDLYLDIEVEGDIENGKSKTRSHYIVKLSVANKVVAELTHPKPRSSMLKWEWTANKNEMLVLVPQPHGRGSVKEGGTL